MIENKLGIEAEYFIVNSLGIPVKPSLNFGHDDFLLLGEIRTKPYSSPNELIADFLTQFYEITTEYSKIGLTVDFSSGYKIIPKSLYKSCLNGVKKLEECPNIYSKVEDIPNFILNDKGKIESYKVSAGLHLHFSSTTFCEKILPEQDRYVPVNLPISYSVLDKSLDINGNITLYKKLENSKHEEKISVVVDNITRPVLEHFVKRMDTLFPKYSLPIELNNRQKGFYRIKPWGFEYRSLPMNQKVLDNLYTILTFAFSLFDSLKLY